MINKLKTIFWFIQRPQYIPQIFQILKRKKNIVYENSRDEATLWCEKLCIEQKNALNHLTETKNNEELIHLFPEEINKAINSANNSPVKMGGEGSLTFIYHLVKHSKAEQIIETGVAYGWSSLSILLAIKDNKKGRLISNDMPYIKMGNDDFVGCIIPEKLKVHWELQRLPDIKGIPLALKKFNNNIDFCHYDSDKSYTGRMWASPLLWNALKKDCFFVADDVNDNLAFKHFCESVNRTPVIIQHLQKYVGVIVK